MSEKLMHTAEFEMPSESRVVKLDYPKEKVVIAKNKLAELFAIFGPKTQVEATPVNR
ncbi:MAG: hypothetical protein NC914_03815 [Candidatus Omnitrophica bacterium]|nr:hypothetical protein [Candidatus Omnitrophota bacterium]